MWFSDTLSRAGRLVKRHKYKFIIGTTLATIAGGGYYLYSKYNELRENIEKEQLNAARKRVHYETNRRTAGTALKSQLPQVKAQIQALIDVESITAKLKERDALSPEEKRELWETMKIQSFTRTITSVYSLFLMHMFLNIQLNIIGRYLFLKYVEDENKGIIKKNNKRQLPAITLSNEVQQQFLSYVAHFQTKGVDMLQRRVRRCVERHVARIPLKKTVTAEEIINLIDSIRQDIEEGIPATTLTTTTTTTTDNNNNNNNNSDNNRNETTTTTTTMQNGGACETDQQQEQQGEDKKTKNNKKKATEEVTLMVGSEMMEPLSLSDILLPPEEDSRSFQMQHHPHLRMLLDELRDILDSGEFWSVFKETAEESFDVLHLHVEKFFSNKRQQKQQNLASSASSIGSTGSSSGTSSDNEATTTTTTEQKQQQQQQQQQPMHLATLIPYITKEIKPIFVSSAYNDRKGEEEEEEEANEYLARIQQVEHLNIFCAMVYSMNMD